MSYLVLARKFRPQTFAEMVGQEHVTQTLSNAIAKRRVHHAFLFCGARGVGKTTAARILARCLSCVNAPTASPCNQCDACRDITAGISVDVQEIDGASNNSVDDVRTLREGVRYLPSRGKKRVYIIDEVHMLSSGAWNALLKTLEEPPDHAVFIFATTEVHKIPITILSRLQRYDFRLVPSSRIVEHLAAVLTQEKIAFERGALQVIAREAAGSVRDALSLLEQLLAAANDALASAAAAAEALGVADRALIEQLGRALLQRDASAALTLLDQAGERAIDWKHLTHRLLEHLRDLVVARTVRDPAGLVEASESELASLVATAQAAPEGLLELLFQRAARVAEEVARSPLPRFVFEVGLVELTRVEPLEPLLELTERLLDLEGRLGGDGARPRPATAAPAGEWSRPGSVGTAAASASSAAAAAVARSSAAMASSAPTPAAVRSPATVASLSATPPPGAVATPGGRPKDWRGLAEALAQRSHRFIIFLEAEEVEFAPPKIIVAFKNAFSVNQARDKLADAQAAIADLLAAPCQIEIREGAGRGPSVMATEEQQRRDERSERLKEALQHPARKLVTERFGDDVQFKDPEVEP